MPGDVLQQLKRDPGVDEGATTIAYIRGKGWFWYVPLANDVVSVGVVADRDYLFAFTHGRGVWELRSR